jgi:glycerate-2-kinase
LARARAAGLDVGRALAENDSHAVLAALGDLVVTGPTETNLMDLYLCLLAPVEGAPDLGGAV